MAAFGMVEGLLRVDLCFPHTSRGSRLSLRQSGVRRCDREGMIDFVSRITDSRFRTELRLVTRSRLDATISVFQGESGFLLGAQLSAPYRDVGIRRPVNTVEHRRDSGRQTGGGRRAGGHS